MLEITDLVAGYGRAVVLDGVSLQVGAGEAITVLGPNGAGKSTLMSVVIGAIRPRSGSIRFDGTRIDGLPTEEVVRMGMVLCPERRHFFASMTVRENLQLGAYLRRNRAQVSADFESILEMFPALERRLSLHAGMLSGGEQQMVAIGRSLMGAPRMLLLDEPSLGLAPALVDGVMAKIAGVSDRGIGLCLVEQNARAALEAVGRGYVLEAGRIVLSGSSDELSNDARVQSAYLGVG